MRVGSSRHAPRMLRGAAVALLAAATAICGVSSNAHAAQLFFVCSACHYTSIQGAVSNAPTNSTVFVLPGTYHEDLVVNSSTTSATNFTLYGIGHVTIDGGGASAPVLQVGDYGETSTKVTVRNVSIKNGAGLAGLYGGGIFNFGKLTLINSAVFGNTATYGGAGIVNDAGASLTLAGFTSIHDNAAGFGGGGGIYNEGTIVMKDFSSVRNNSASSGGGGGGIVNGSGSLTMLGHSTVRNNTVTGGGVGGGIWELGGQATLWGSGAVYGNSPDNCNVAIPPYCTT